MGNTGNIKAKMKKAKKQERKIRLIPPILLFSLYPLLFGGVKVRAFLQKYAWFPSGEMQYDFFMYVKSRAFLVLAIWMMLILADRILLQRRKLTEWKRFAPLCIYAALAMISATLSVNRQLSFTGMWEHYEHVWVLLGYMAAAIYCANIVEEREDIELLAMALCTGAFLQSLIGVGQIVGMNLLESGIGKTMLTMGLDASAKEGLVFQFGAGSRNCVYMTLYNPNYVGVYTILLLPVTITMMFCMKKIWQRIMAGTTSGLLLICLFGSGSRTGMAVGIVLIGMGGWLVSGIYMIQRRIATGALEKSKRWLRIKQWSVAAAGIIALLAAILVYDIAEDGAVRKTIRQSLRKVEAYHLEELYAGEHGVYMTYCGAEFRIEARQADGIWLPAVYRLTDGSEQPVELKWKEAFGWYRIPGEEFRRIGLMVYENDGQIFLYVDCQKISWYFVKDRQTDTYTYVTQYGKSDEIVDAPAVLQGREKILSGRGYIWGRTIPLLPKYLLWGSGPDTFVLAFPQRDYRMHANTGVRASREIVSKAHNMYLQTAVQTGMLSLLCLLVFWIIYIRESIMIYRRSERAGKCGGLRSGIFLGVIGYLLMGMLNDSVVAVAPVFWGMLGIGIAINRQTYH
ncbi:MAG: O-antigen ligase family protein [Eubacteriales bacterium]|nr:O-antigen ligase family protein [Eubacteriales bacterium]